MCQNKKIEAVNDQKKHANAFFTLCEHEWTDSISSRAIQTLEANKVNKGP